MTPCLLELRVRNDLFLYRAPNEGDFRERRLLPATTPKDGREIRLPSAAALREERPDETWCVVGDDHAIHACGSLWWTDVASWRGLPTGAFGHFSAADRRSAQVLLDHAAQRLAARGCKMMVGPMNGSTWRSYRLVTASNGRSPFLLEPETPLAWAEDMRRGGLSPIAAYFSTITDDLDSRDLRVREWGMSLPRRGVTIRPFSLERAEQDLLRVHALTNDSFRRNFLFSPQTADDFLNEKQRLLPMVRPELFLLAEQGQRLVGYLFAYPDYAQARRGQKIDTVVMKTVAVRREREIMGLGRWLADRVLLEAARLGFSTAIFALMHESNYSNAWGRKHGALLRRYELFGRPL